MHGIKEPVGGLCQQQIGSYVPELDEVISFEEVCMAIKSMKPRKSPGVDGNSTEVYKALPDHLVQLLTKMFNEILVTGEYPASWLVGLICPIYKTGGKEEPNNYRGITLLNCIGKIFPSILNTRLKDWAGKKFPEAQYGFRENRRAMDCIFILNTLIEKTRANHSQLFLAMLT